LVRQKFEWAESIGYETRNKYQILREDGVPFAYAAEQGQGVLGILLRQFFGHWRRYDLHFFTPTREPMLVAHHPFRFFFHRLEIFTPDGRPLGAIQKRFSLLSKRFDVENESGSTILEVRSPIWKPWTFSFQHLDREQAVIRKRWSGIFSETFSDRDNFLIEFLTGEMRANERALILAAALFIDMMYFEKKAN
jgi:uncharacterized protein YxjI